MTKVVYACYGGFSISDEATRMYLDLKGLKYTEEKTKWGTYFEVQGHPSFCGRSDIERNDPILVQVVETLGDKPNSDCAKLRIEDIPKGTLYRISEYDGYESIETRDGIDWKVA